MNSDPPSRSRVLVIDDDTDLQQLVIMLLNRASIPTTSVGTAAEGIMMLNQEDFELVILDLMLPDMDGLDLLQSLRQDVQFDQLSILILSARADSEAISRALKLGADGYLTKPYISLSLTQRVTSLLAYKRGQAMPSESS